MTSVLQTISRFATRSVTSAIHGAKPTGVINSLRLSSTITSVFHQLFTRNTFNNPLTGTSAISAVRQCPLQLQPCRTYKVKTALKLRCSSCYFVKRHGRLFVECKSKPRHKQMQRVARRNLFKDDYSIGTPGAIRRACFYGYRHDRYYDLGKNEYSRHNWLEEKIGRTI